MRNLTMETKLIPNKDFTIDDLPVFKNEVRQRIEEQKNQLISTAQGLIPFNSKTTTSITPLSLITAPFRKTKVMTVVEGVIIGYNIVRKIRRLLRK
jgi:hypothetical protein